MAATAVINAHWMVVGKVKPELASNGGEEPPTVNVARGAMKKAGVKSPSSDVRTLGGKAVHWGYGTTWGLIAGASRASGVPLTWGGGLLFGTGLWALGDLWMLYKMGLAKHPREYPMEVNAAALGAHLAYGLAAWAVMDKLGKVPKKRYGRRAA